MSKAIQMYKGFEDLQRVATALARSGYFKSNQEQAIAKVVAGAEIGLPPFASMSGIHIIKGKPTLGSNLIATLVENDTRYEYRVKESTDKQCVIVWFKHNEEVGQSSFDMSDAKRAGLLGKSVWNKYPSDLLFARAITQGARRYAAGIFGGAPVYTPEEMGEDVVDGVVVENPESKTTKPEQPSEPKAPEPVQASRNGQPVEPRPPREQSKTAKPKSGRPLAAVELKGFLLQKAGKHESAARSASPKQRQALPDFLTIVYEDDVDRHAVTEWLFNHASTSDLKDGHVLALLDWLSPEKNESGWAVADYVLKEASAMLTQVKKSQGQDELM